MANAVFDREAAQVAVQLPVGPRVTIIGSSSFWRRESEATCNALGPLLASLKSLVLLTGGVGGVGEAVGRSFYAARPESGGHRGVFHILPRGGDRWDYGETLFAGSHMGERREILGRLSDIYVAVEGGPGTAHEASVALSRSALVVPIGRSGGYAGELYPQLAAEVVDGSREAWRMLASDEATPGLVAEAVRKIVALRLVGV